MSRLAESVKQTRVYQEGILEGSQLLVLKQLTRRIGEISLETQSQVEALSLYQLEALGKALLDFSEPSDLTDWLLAHPPV